MRAQRQDARILLSRGRLAAVAALLCCCLAGEPALAFFSEKEQLLDHTAYTLEAREFKFGIWDVGFGPAEWLTFDTYLWPWLLKIYNLSVKGRVWRDGNWTVAAKAGYFYFNIRNWSDSAAPVTFHIIPLEATVSRRLGSNWTVSGGLVYTPMILKGQYDAADLKGAAGYSNAQLTLSAELKLSKRWALFARSRHLLYMEVSGRVDNTVQLDPYTRMETHASLVAEDIVGMGFPQTFQVVPGIAFSDTQINAELGLGYGNFNFPGMNFVMPVKIPVPTFDFYVRW